VHSEEVFHRHRPLGGNFRSKCGGNIGMMACLIRITWPARLLDKDTSPEWSKGVDSSSTSASCVSSNPTGVIW
jgi:hypothetical protein